MLKKIFSKTFFVSTDIKFHSVEWKPQNKTHLCQGCLPCIGNQEDIAISLLTMITTANTGKNQQISGIVREESVEAI